MNAYALPGLDLHLQRGSDAGQLRKDAADRICDDYDAMTEVYADAAAHLIEFGDMPDVLRALDRAAYVLGQLLDGKTSTNDPDTRVLLRELVRQAKLVDGRVDCVIDDRVEEAL